jgi:Zn-dependent M28 family amino/carboxypeptidase
MMVFDGQRAYDFVKYQVDLGPRVVGSEAHYAVTEWITNDLKTKRWEVNYQEGEISGIHIRNIVAKRGIEKPWIIIGSHYDSRMYADRDTVLEGRKLPVIGANDGASSVAILLELARIIPVITDKQIWLVFFDAEDNANISGHEGLLGSRYFVSVLEGKPDRVIILDMVGDKELNIHMELNSDPDLNVEIWKAASDLGYSQFIPTYKHEIIDDHIPFIKADIRAVTVIDFDYPYWHTTHDTLDKISAGSLAIVGEAIIEWLKQYP